MKKIETLAQLLELYGAPAQAAIVKETTRLHPLYQEWIKASPLLALATAGPEGLDCSPRGERPCPVRIVDDETLLLPDRRGNNRIDSLRNILHDPRVALLFFIPGFAGFLRVNGRAKILIEPSLLADFERDGARPLSVLEIKTDAVYLQCSRAILRSELWSSDGFVDPKTLPSVGALLTALTKDSASAKNFDGAAYDAQSPERAAKTLW